MAAAAPGLIRMLLVVFVGAGLLFSGTHRTWGAPVVDGPKIVVKITNSSQVYYPATLKKGAKYKKPAVLKTSTVFAKISEWQEIKKKKLTEKDAEYHLLLKKANDKFSSAVTSVQISGSYDIMAEDGAISCTGCTAKDVSQDVVNALP